MQAPLITKYGFRIRTRSGLVVDNLMIHGRDEDDARRKLCQMYLGCEVLDCNCHTGSARAVPTSYEEVLGLLAR